MMQASSRDRVAAVAMLIHDAALLGAVFYSPIFWGAFNPAGQAFAAAMIGLAVLAAVIARWSQGKGPVVIPNAVHLPAVVFLAISGLSAIFSVSHHASAVEFSRLVIGALLFCLVASRAALPMSPPKAVAAVFACSILLIPFIRVPGESGLNPSTLANADLLSDTFSGPGATLRLFALIGVALVSTLIVVDRAKADPVAWWTRALVVAAAFAVAAYGVREAIISRYLLNNPSWPIFSTFFNKNPLGGFLAMTAFLALGLTLAAHHPLRGRSAAPGVVWRRALWGFSTLLLTATIIPTHSKGAMVGLVAAAVVCAVLAAWGGPRRKRNLGALLALLAAAAAAIALVFSLRPSLRARAAEPFSLETASNRFRLLTWEGTLRMAARHPVVGVGPGAFKYDYMNYAIAGYTEAAHENYLQVAAEQGFLGLAAFLWMLGAVLFTARRALARAGGSGQRILIIGAIGSLTVLLVHSLLDFDWYIGAIGLLFWFVAGVIAHHAHGREVAAPAPQPQDVPPARPPRRGRSPRQAAPPRTDPDAGLHRLPWPRSSEGRLASLVLLVAALVWWFVIPFRYALAQTELALGDKASAFATQANAQGDSTATSQYVQTALRHYRDAAAYDPDWARARESYGLIQGTEQGRQEIVRATELEPTSFQPWLSMAQHYYLQKRYAEAAQAYRESISRYPNNTRALRKLAVSYQQLGDLADALSVYRQMERIENSSYNKYRALGDIDVDTEYAYAHYQLGRVALQEYRASPKLDTLLTAIKEFRAALAIIAAYQSRGRQVDAMFQQVGQPREDRGSELQVLEARTRWRIAEALDYAGVHPGASLHRAAAVRLFPEVAQATAAEDGGAAQ
jgi:O-antigen ligase/tetratricopeptide (TPR) repeat protein